MRFLTSVALILLLLPAACGPAGGSDGPEDVRKTATYARIRAALDAVPAINSHDHLQAPGNMPFQDPTSAGKGMTLHSLWAGSYLTYITDVTAWPADRSFATWWKDAQSDFDAVRAASFYRYMLPAFRDLYDVDFETMTDEQASTLNDRIFANYRDPDWIRKVIVERANIERVIVDPFWSRLAPPKDYAFTAPLLNVHTLVMGSHPGQDQTRENSPYLFAERQGRKIKSLEDYVAVLDLIMAEAVRAGAVGLKSTQAYTRTLDFENVSRERAVVAFGTPPDRVTPQAQKDFEDYIMWRLAALAAKYDLPFQIHTGRGRPDGSNPMLLFDLIAGNWKTKFVLLHGGYPWIDDTAVLAQTHANVWVDTAWMPILSYSVAKRAFHEFLECMPADRIMWGTDCVHPEGIYGATVMTRRCLAEALTEKVLRGELREEHALDIGRMILRDNAKKLYTRIR